jgi:hypothetical protein
MNKAAKRHYLESEIERHFFLAGRCQENRKSEHFSGDKESGLES